MTNWQKIFIGMFTVLVWVLAIIAKHNWADVDVTGIILLCQATLGGLGITHIMSPLPLNQTGN